MKYLLLQLKMVSICKNRQILLTPEEAVLRASIDIIFIYIFYFNTALKSSKQS